MSNVTTTEPPDFPFDDYCQKAGDCRACAGVNCTCPHHAPAEMQTESLYDRCHRVWVCKRCGNCLDHCRHKEESNFHEDLSMPCSVRLPKNASTMTTTEPSVEELTPEQIENWRKALIGLFGPYALMMPADQIQRLRNRMQGFLDGEQSQQGEEAE